MANETMTKVTGKVLVNNGTTATGTAKTASINLPTLSKARYTPALLLAVCTLYDSCLAKSVNAYQVVKTYDVDE